MAITKVINDAVNLNQTSDYSGLKLPVGTTEQQGISFNLDYLVVAGGGGTGTDSPGGGGAGGLITSYNNSSTTTNTLSFPSGKTAIATYMLNGNATDVSGTYSGTANSYVSYNTGKYGGAAIFDGASSYIDLPAGLAPPIRTAAKFAVSLWFKRNGNQINSYGGRLIQLLNDIYININLQTDNTVKALVVTSTPTYPETVTGVVPDNTWNHIVFTGDNNGIKLYLNKSLADSDSWDGTFMTYTNSNYKFNRIGYSGSSVAYYTGEIDQVRIYSDVLDQTDVDNIYNNEVQVNSGGGTAATATLALTGGTPYIVTVGEGGTKAAGSNSVFYNITSNGGGSGGGAGSSSGYPGGNGGSGGGGSGGSYSSSGGTGDAGQGYAGGRSGANTGGSGYPGGGGGGASARGQSLARSQDNGGTGGNGVIVNILNSTNAASSYIGEVSSSDVYYAGGGGGSTYTTTLGAGGLGGGADGQRYLTAQVTNNGTTNTGGGGGAQNSIGGSGVVVLRYATADVTSFTTSGSLITPSATDTLASAAYPVTNLAYYKLDGNALDSSGNGYNGAESNMTYVNGLFAQTAKFNGSSSTINYGTGTSNAFALTTYTASLWINSNDYNQSNVTVLNLGFDNTGSVWRGIAWSLNANKIKIYGGDATGVGGSGFYQQDSTVTLTNGAWIHLVFIVNGTSITAYINGTQDTSLSRTLGANVSYSSNSQFALGVRSGNFGSYGYYNGSIDQFRFFNSALSSTDVSDLYDEHYRTLYTEGSDTVLIFNRGTGNINFTYAGSAPPTGAIRTNTDSSPGSANSGIEVYNGTEFKTFSATLS